jgi:hypothetical protein
MQNSITIYDLISPPSWRHSGYEQGALVQLSTGLAIQVKRQTVCSMKVLKKNYIHIKNVIIVLAT